MSDKTHAVQQETVRSHQNRVVCATTQRANLNPEECLMLRLQACLCKEQMNGSVVMVSHQVLPNTASTTSSDLGQRTTVKKATQRTPLTYQSELAVSMAKQEQHHWHLQHINGCTPRAA